MDDLWWNVGCLMGWNGGILTGRNGGIAVRWRRTDRKGDVDGAAGMGIVPELRHERGVGCCGLPELWDAA